MARRTDPPAATVRLVRERDDHRCARCGRSASFGYLPLTTQHRVARGMGGTKDPAVNLPSNLLTLCGDGTRGCHGWVEANPAEAKDHGWSVRRGQPPAEVPVWTWRGWVLLDNSGGLAATRVSGAPLCACGCQAPEPIPGLWDQPVSI